MQEASFLPQIEATFRCLMILHETSLPPLDAVDNLFTPRKAALLKF